LNTTFKRRLIQFRVVLAGFMIFGALLSAPPAHAADEVGASDITISGTLTNGDSPLSGVSISAKGPNDFSKTVTSDESGSWTIVVPVEDVYTVSLDETTLPAGVKLSADSAATQEVDLVGMGFAGVGFQFGNGATVQEQSFFEQFMIRAFSGINYGLILAMAAIGISLIYATTGLNNFAHGEVVSILALFT
jgi:neutral amino acid transport system permease protein